MNEMTGKERISNILRGKPVDRIGLYEHFWGDTLAEWQQAGHISQNQDLGDHFNFDLNNCWCLNTMVDPNFQDIIIEEDEETCLYKNGNGATLRRHKQHSSTPEHVDFSVTNRKQWEELAKPFLVPNKERIGFESYRNAKKYAEEKEIFFNWSGISVFEMMHPLCGHEHMLYGMADDPDWIEDMAKTYADLNINLLEELFAQEGQPDGLWYYEDMGFKHRPFMSPGMYEELIQPSHKRIHDWAHERDLPVIMHSCGFIEPLLPGMVESGIDCLQVIEIKAGMDLLRIHEKFGDKIALCGGMDARNLVANDKEAITRELKEKIPSIVKGGKGYILHSDHSIPTNTEYGTYRHFVDTGLELGVYGA